MAMEARLLQKLNQQLMITPQLQQAIKLLQLGHLEYMEAIEEQLLENPLLEEIREHNNENQDQETNRNTAESERSTDATEILTTNFTQEEMHSLLDSLSDWKGAASAKNQDDNDRPEPEQYLSKDLSLTDVLLEQLRFSEITEQQLPIALHVIGNLDPRGYLSCTAEYIAEQCGVVVADVELVLSIIQSFEPLGVGARNLQECLLIQLVELGYEGTLAHKIVRDYIEQLEKKKYEEIIQKESTTKELLLKALDTVRSLEPFPARNYSDNTDRAVTPDVFVKKIGDEFVVTLNEDGLPKLRVNQNYIEMLKNESTQKTAADEQKVYLQDRLKAAHWLIKSDLQRRQTILKVATSIVTFQSEFLEHGVSKLKPLVLKTVADEIGMHESTVSRVTANKYIDTPQGIFELKFFFTTGIKAAGGDVSSSAVKDRIKALISAEDPKKPISDQDICEILKKEKVLIARRTVAKYREGLGIESSSLRKRNL